MTKYVLAGGCFWCLDAVFRELRGVESSIVGYVGGSAETANYYAVISGRTGHAESVQVTVDETVLPIETLLDIYFLIHDPTSLDRQGADVGPQYASVMFYADEAQKADFEAAVTRAQANWDAPIVTRLEPLDVFYPAEPEHQDYFAQNPANPYCSVVINPKVIKAKRAYRSYFKEES